MSNQNCCCRFNCTFWAIVLSIAIGVVTAFLTIMGMITLTSAFLWATLGIAVVYLAVALATVNFREGAARCCSALAAILIGALGTALFSIVLLAISFPATSVLGAILAGAVLFFLFLTLTATACFIRCQALCD